jgi:hypothetical protein
MSLVLAPGDDVEDPVESDMARGGNLAAYPLEAFADLRVPDDAMNDLPDVAAAASG